MLSCARAISAAFLAAAVLFSASEARAEEARGTTPVSRSAPFGRAAFSIERVIGLGMDSAVSAPIAMRAPWDLSAPVDALPIRAPRFAFDGRLGDHLTVGAAAMFAYSTSDMFVQYGSGTYTSVLLGGAARVGYLIPYDETTYFWLRGALHASHIGTHGSGSGYNKGTGGTDSHTSDTDATAFGLSLEPTMVIRLADHAAITASLDLDLPTFGSRWQNGGQAQDWHAAGAGLSLGMMF
jgi:hypothetical protein